MGCLLKTRSRPMLAPRTTIATHPKLRPRGHRQHEEMEQVDIGMRRSRSAGATKVVSPSLSSMRARGQHRFRSLCFFHFVFGFVSFLAPMSSRINSSPLFTFSTLCYSCFFDCHFHSSSELVRIGSFPFCWDTSSPCLRCFLCVLVASATGPSYLSFYYVLFPSIVRHYTHLTSIG
ncbi:hypothetical protein BDN72DRAFT_383996 [Pluteus cervinus]|uniref:Uncharacterized protein n=1 Tax=Pluteus cervinus TaxID=181527 RepID=A0ACD3AAA2_9AGAR|nr:hypothetical protein BDN72DRAFT_383996 [Pluteus cervinus]